MSEEEKKEAKVPMGQRVERERTWDSCFNDEHSYLAGGGAVSLAARISRAKSKS